MRPDLRKLIEAYPLSEQWEFPELYMDSLTIERFRIDYAGLVTQNRAGISITGSAAGPGESPLLRGYFELLERASLVEAERDPRPAYFLTDQTGCRVRTCTREEAFPFSPEPHLWRYAKSNGVAAHERREVACRNAALELVERDRVLRAWYGELLPERIPLPDGLISVDLGLHYDFEAYRLGPAGSFEDLGAVTVVAVLGFPRHAHAPRINGFSARATEREALEAAVRESLQTMSFLWGEPIPAEVPSIELLGPSPDYHQEVYLVPANVGKLRAWLSGGHRAYGLSESNPEPRRIEFLDITPAHLRAKLVVVKAIGQGFVPLTFGACPHFAPKGFPKDLLVHLIA